MKNTNDPEYILSQQKQDPELTVAQIMSSLLQNSDLNWKKLGKPLVHSYITYIKSLWLHSGSNK